MRLCSTMCLRGNLYLPVGLKYELAARAYVYIQHVQRQSDRWPQICVRSCEVIIRLQSEDDLEGEGGSRQRPRFEKMAYSPDGGSEDEDDVQPERPVKKPSGPKQELLDMLKRKKDDICRKEETATKKQKKRETYDDRGSLVKQLQNKNNTLEKEAMELRRLNVRLQEKILTALDEGKGNSRAACSIKSKPEHSRMELIDIDMDVIPRETTPPPDDCPRKENATRQGIPENLVPAALKQLNHFVVEKLADLERMAKREKDNLKPQESCE
ncbi:hypothetical protein MRX96_010138 [Rhipicephalus microplus]